jgi:hypothetical protein
MMRNGRTSFQNVPGRLSDAPAGSDVLGYVEKPEVRAGFLP